MGNFFSSSSEETGGSSSSSSFPCLTDAIYPMRKVWLEKYAGQPGYDVKPVEDWSQLRLPQEQEETKVRFVCISDTHSRQRKPGSVLDSLPAGDVLIHCGDFTNLGGLQELRDFASWMGKQKQFKHRVVIAGNHDICLDRNAPKTEGGRAKQHRRDSSASFPEDVRSLLMPHCTYLEDASATVCGYKIFGSPWTPTFGHGWAFNKDRGNEIAAAWNQIPDDTDILLTHGPPLGCLDICSGGERAGCEDLLKTVVERVKPKLHVFGHIHEDYGVSSNGTTTFVNASTCRLMGGHDWRTLNDPIVFELPFKN